MEYNDDIVDLIILCAELHPLRIAETSLFICEITAETTLEKLLGRVFNFDTKPDCAFCIFLNTAGTFPPREVKTVSAAVAIPKEAAIVTKPAFIPSVDTKATARAAEKIKKLVEAKSNGATIAVSGGGNSANA